MLRPRRQGPVYHAALRVKKMLIEMLMAEQLGAVLVEVTPAGLQPVKRIEDRPARIKVSRGQNMPIETVT